MTSSSDTSSLQGGIVFGIDIGAFNSSVSFLDLGGELRQISEWYKTLPDGQKSLGNFVPTRMYYARNSTDSKPTFYGSGNENEYELVKGFKSEMIRPSDYVKRCYTHWLEYLFENARHAFGRVSPDVWANRQVVMVVPNSWDLAQRVLLKDAIIHAGWVGHDKEKHIKFLRECEATLHCLIKDQPWKSQDLGVGKEFIVLDTGHISYDIALYRVERLSPLRFREMAGKPPETVHKVIGGIQQAHHKSPADAAKDQRRKLLAKVNKLKGNAKVLILAGDLDDATKELLKKELEIVSVGRQNAADGAISWFKERAVVAHAAPCFYGVEVFVPYVPGLDYMKDRKYEQYVNGKLVPHGWSPIVNYGDVLEGHTTRKLSVYETFQTRDASMKIDVELFAARENADKHWICDTNGKRYDEFMQISTVKADLSNLRSKLVERRSPDDNSRYYRLDFEVEIVFDSINLRANIIRDGKKYGDAILDLDDKGEWRQRRSV